MKPAQLKFASYMEKADFHNLSAPLISNVNAQIITDAKEIRGVLVEQLSAPVLWWQSMQHFRECDIIIEIGPGSKLSNLLAKEWKDKTLLSINDQRDINHLLTLLKN
jgi:[acyl-carrier-protein] S-malonyltransferase